ncbi:MAG TPA: UDP-3-O-(3-hydroxymyristoyl)glucosamine N-acyltransferase [Thermoanaerobaculia bacterium]|nr:UDP-3-O-(3-hydroxymyristoyl)glucosamine N-acyltransferase [Thermoanaerobaculia bacterium]
MRARPARLGDLAAAVGGTVRGNPDRVVSGLLGLEEAGPDELSFLIASRYRGKAAASGAGALLVPASEADRPELAGRDLLVADPVEGARVVLLATLYPPLERPAGIHPTASIEAGAEVDPSATVGAYVVVGEGSVVGPRSVLHPHVVVGRCCRLGAEVVLHPHVVLYDDTELGERVVIHAGTVVGADGFGYWTERGVHRKVPQVGRVVVEADVEIGALSAIDRATVGETSIGAGTKIDNLVQVGHNVKVGKGAILCGQAGIAGSTRLGDYVVLGGQTGVLGHIEVAAGTQVASKSAVLGPVEERSVLAGVPAVPIGSWRRQVAGLARLAEVLRRLRLVERKLGLGRVTEEE